MTSTFTTSLGEVIFTAHAGGFSEDPKLAYEVVGYPGGNTFDVTVAGQRETRRTVGLHLSSKADYETLADMLGLSGYLLIDGWDINPRAAILVGCKPEAIIYSGGTVMAQGDFILL